MQLSDFSAEKMLGHLVHLPIWQVVLCTNKIYTLKYCVSEFHEEHCLKLMLLFRLW